MDDVAIFSRPQGAVGGRGEIGFTIAPSWDAITAEMIARRTALSQDSCSKRNGAE